MPEVEVISPGAKPKVFRGPEARRAKRVEGSKLPVPEGWLHQVTITGLRPSTRITYRIRCGHLAGRGGNVATAPRAGEGFSFVALGDTRNGHDDHRLVALGAAKLAPDVLFHTGDMVPSGTPAEWRPFFDIEAALLSSALVVPALGNHEHIQGRDMFRHYFPCRERGPAGTESCVRDYGDTRFIVLDTQGSLEQISWVRTMLQGWKDKLTVVIFHRPIHTMSHHPPLPTWQMLLHPVLVERDVDLVLQGHNHVYERFEIDGVTYVTTGGGGAPLYPVGSPGDEDDPRWRKAAAARHHYVVGRVAAGGADIEAIDARTGAVLDRFSIR